MLALLRWFDEICNLHCCLWNLISESVTQREGSCNKSGVISFFLRLYCGFDYFSKTNKIFSKWRQEKDIAIDNEREKQVQLTNNPKKSNM